MTDNSKNSAVFFLEMVSSGNVDEAYSKFIGEGFKHHLPKPAGSPVLSRRGGKRACRSGL